MVKLLKTILLLSLYTNIYSQSTILFFSHLIAYLGQYKQILVNYFNGLQEISNSLITLKAKGYELPTSLTYNASRNKPDSHSGWVGLVWPLHVGGMVNHIIAIRMKSRRKSFRILVMRIMIILSLAILLIDRSITT